MSNKKPEIHAHRGTRVRLPENTLEAYQYALDSKADAIEVDIALTKDKIPVLHHDRHLESGEWIKDLSLEELHQIKPKVPTLDQFIKLLQEHDSSTKLNLEIKTCAFHPEETLDPQDFAHQILELLQKNNVPQERVLFQSFDPRIIIELREQNSKHEISFLLDDWSDDCVEVAQELNCQALSPRWDLLTQERVRQIIDSGLKLYTWTVNDLKTRDQLAEWGVSGIITDNPKDLAFKI